MKSMIISFQSLLVKEMIGSHFSWKAHWITLIWNNFKWVLDLRNKMNLHKKTIGIIIWKSMKWVYVEWLIKYKIKGIIKIDLWYLRMGIIIFIWYVMVMDLKAIWLVNS